MLLDQNPLLQRYLDDLSARDLRELLGLLLATYFFRAADVPREHKYSGRQAQKSLAILLNKTDADWMLREFILNAGRVLYKSTDKRHGYYGEGLNDLIGRMAKDLGRKKDAAEFCKATEEFAKLTDSGPAWATGVVEVNVRIFRIATGLVEDILAKNGVEYFTKSERRLVAGVVGTHTVRKLQQPKS